MLPILYLTAPPFFATPILRVSRVVKIRVFENFGRICHAIYQTRGFKTRETRCNYLYKSRTIQNCRICCGNHIGWSRTCSFYICKIPSLYKIPVQVIFNLPPLIYITIGKCGMINRCEIILSHRIPSYISFEKKF